METIQAEAPKFNFKALRKEKEVGSNLGLDLTKGEEGPIAVTYDMELGWIVRLWA